MRGRQEGFVFVGYGTSTNIRWDPIVLHPPPYPVRVMPMLATEPDASAIPVPNPPTTSRNPLM